MDVSRCSERMLTPYACSAHSHTTIIVQPRQHLHLAESHGVCTNCVLIPGAALLLHPPQDLQATAPRGECAHVLLIPRAVLVLPDVTLVPSALSQQLRGSL